jgi:hypothetical protein
MPQGISDPRAPQWDGNTGALLGRASTAPPYGKGQPIQDQNVLNILDENSQTIVG